jgi:hypothetical protein
MTVLHPLILIYQMSALYCNFNIYSRQTFGCRMSESTRHYLIGEDKVGTVFKILQAVESNHLGLVRGLSRRMDTRFLRIRRNRQLGVAEQDAPRLSSPSAKSDMLLDFVEGSQLWSRERVPAPRRLRLALWVLLPVELFWAIWLATIVTGATACRGPICTVTTLDHHAAALLACGVFSVAGLVGLMPTTRGFSRCNGPEVIGLAAATATSGASLLGIAALMIGALVLLIIPATFILASTATSRRETDHARSRAPFPIALVDVASRSRTR